MEVDKGKDHTDDNVLSRKTMLAIPFKKPQKELKKIEGTLQPIEWKMATISDDEILIEVRAFGLNFADVIARKGYYDDAPPYPFIPGYECAGIIAALGDSVPRKEDDDEDGFYIGQRVLALTEFGGYAQYAAAKHMGVFQLPDGMNFAEGASIPVIFATAYHSIFHTGLIFEGDKVLIHAAAGGLGLAAVQLCKNAGCEVFGTASKPEKLRLLSEDFGVDHVINYRTHDFEDEVRRIEGTRGSCLDLVLDSVGGSQFKKDMALLQPSGRVIGLGAASFVKRGWSTTLKLIPGLVSMMTFSSIDMMMGSKSFCGVNMKRLSEAKPGVVRKAMSAVLDLFAEGKLRTCLLDEENAVYPWTQVGKVHELMEARKTQGKIVFVIPKEGEEEEEEREEEKEE